MRLKVIISVVLINLVAAFAISSFVKPASGYSEPLIEEMQFNGAGFEGGVGHGFAVTTRGLMMAETAVTTHYTSPEIEATIPFNAIVPQWQANLPTGSSLTIQLRTRSANGVWSDWFVIEENHDWTEPEDAFSVGNMIAVPELDSTHTHVQYAFNLGRYEGLDVPSVTAFTLILIDSTSGPTVEEMVAQQQAIDAEKLNNSPLIAANNPRPTVISREVWCISDSCDYTNDLEYSPATHMVVHHTVSSNDSVNWAATVRAVWSFHTFSRDWGDIGYNYLVDMDGFIYEGHMNEDFENLDVRGTHAGGANLGGMGVSLLGTFTEVDHAIPGIQPPQAMQDSLVALLSWKAEQRGINVYDATDALPDIGWGLANLMGHRDVYGTTECPGDQAFALLPLLRDRVAANIDLVDPYIRVDELGVDFTRSASSWFAGPNECGNDGHSFYTWSTTDPVQSSNWGEWRPQIPVNGRYRIELRIPYCNTGRGETDGATYTIDHANGTTVVVASHEDGLGGWLNLGEYDLLAGNSNVIHLTDLTTTDDGLGVWFDDMRLLKLEPSVTASAPVDTAWVNDPNVNFSWLVSDIGSVQTSTLQIATDAAFSNSLLSKEWSGTVFSYTHTFTENVDALYWQVSIVVSGTGAMSLSPITQLGVDTAVPTSAITALHKMPSNQYELFWQGSDTLSGIAGYNLAYRAIGETVWADWLTTTPNNSVIFDPPDPELPYEFMVTAVDAAGNLETKSTPDISTLEAVSLPYVIMLPLIKK